MVNMVMSMKNIPKKRKNRTLYIALLFIVSMIAMAGCGLEEKKDYVETTVETEDTAESEVILKTGQVVYDGKHYTYNEHLSNFLFMGVDKTQLEDTDMGSAKAGQTDALFLVSWDRVTGDVTLISIPRDTMTDINMFNVNGEDLGPIENHISLAYGYGDGKHESCQLTKEAVSRLFYRIPIQGYCAVVLDALEQVSTTIGPVTVTVPNDSLEVKDTSMKEGTEVVVDESNIEVFVRYRDITESNSAIKRLERQDVFLEACFDKIQKSFQTNPKIITQLYQEVTPYMVTNMGNDQFLKIMEGIVNGGSITKWTVPGEGVSTDTFDEYHVDEDQLYEQILQSFFEVE